MVYKRNLWIMGNRCSFFDGENGSCNLSRYNVYKYTKERIKIQLVPATKFGRFLCCITYHMEGTEKREEIRLQAREDKRREEENKGAEKRL